MQTEIHPLIAHCADALNDPRKEMREAAIDTLVRTPIPEAAQVLINALRHPNLDLVDYCMRALIQSEGSILALADWSESSTIVLFEDWARSDDDKQQVLEFLGIVHSPYQSHMESMEILAQLLDMSIGDVEQTRASPTELISNYVNIRESRTSVARDAGRG